MEQKIHLKAPKNWINDPNGFIYYKGFYHLFYQYFPYGTSWGTMHWGHAVSKDLVRWEHLDLALFPTIYADQNGCFSGSAVEKDGSMYLFYTGVRYEEVNPENIHTYLNDHFEASQLMISSPDGFQFDNFQGKKVVIPPITDKNIGDRTHTRDPKVWRGTDAWYMVLGTTSEAEGGKLLFYRSEDLVNWGYVNQVSKNHKLGWMWECPDFFEIGTEKMLVFSPIDIMKKEKNYANQAICTLVTFDEKSCHMEIPDSYQFLDYGLDIYAPQSTVDEAGRRVIVGWMRMPKAVDNKWNGMFCMPRIVEIKNGHIYFRLHPNLKNAFCRQISSVSEAEESSYCIQLDLQEGEYLSIGGYSIAREHGKIVTDRTKVFSNLTDYQLRFETPTVKEGTHLDIYVDKNLIEVYVNDGEYVVSNVVYDLGQEIETNAKAAYTLLTSP